jgi:hypothetical protein
VNKSNDIVPDVQLHLYLNAFRSRLTTFYKESGGTSGYKESDFGWIDIKSLTDREGSDLIPEIQYVSPDDRNRGRGSEFMLFAKAIPFQLVPDYLISLVKLAVRGLKNFIIFVI